MTKQAQNLDEPELINQAKTGSAESFGALADRYRPRLLAFLRGRCSAQDAEDLAQEALLRAYQGLRSFDTGRPFGNWLMTIAANLAANHHRDNARVVPLDAPQSVPFSDADAAAADHSSGQSLWGLAQQRLSARQYAVLHCRYAQGLSVKETARAVGISGIYAKVLLHRARRKLLACPQFVQWVERNT